MLYPEIHNAAFLQRVIDFSVKNIQRLPNVSFSLVGFASETGMTGTDGL
jgi:hypothetical protein